MLQQLDFLVLDSAFLTTYRPYDRAEGSDWIEGQQDLQRQEPASLRILLASILQAREDPTERRESGRGASWR